MSAITNQARTLANADKTFTAVLNEVVQAIALALGDDPTFDEWESGAAEFRKTYAEARGCTEKTADNRWSAVTAELNSQYGLEKPKKPTVAAATKAAQRSERAIKVDALAAEHGTMEDLMKAASKADKTTAKLYADAIAKKAIAVEKAAKEDAREALKALKAELTKLATGMTVAQLTQLVKHARKLAPVASEASADAQASTDSEVDAEIDADDMGQDDDASTDAAPASAESLAMLANVFSRTAEPAMV